jgi:hypothetical protein
VTSWLTPERGKPTSFGNALPRVDAPEQASTPWTALGVPPGDPVLRSRTLDVDAIRAEAAAIGRREGLASLDAERAELAKVRDALERAAAERAEIAAGVLAETAFAVIAAWVGHAPEAHRDALIAVMNRWLSRHASPTVTILCHPSRVDAIRAACGEIVLVAVDHAVGVDELRVRHGETVLEHRVTDALESLRVELGELFAGVAQP